MNSENNNTFNNINSGYNPQVQKESQNTQPVYQQSTYQTQPLNPQPVQNVDPMVKVSNLNKEDAMEEALSHTNQYTPFEAPKQEIIEAPKQESAKSAYILIGVIVVIMALFIAFLPQISKLFGW